MSRDWTPKELAQASAIMQSDGHMGYNEFCREVAQQTGTVQTDGFTDKCMHWYVEQVGENYDLFALTNEDADTYSRVCTGSYDECMAALSNL